MRKNNKLFTKTFSILNVRTLSKDLKEEYKKRKNKDEDPIDFVVKFLMDRAIMLRAEEEIEPIKLLTQKTPNELKINAFHNAMIKISNSLAQLTTVEEAEDQLNKKIIYRFTLLMLPLRYEGEKKLENKKK